MRNWVTDLMTSELDSVSESGVVEPYKYTSFKNEIDKKELHIQGYKIFMTLMVCNKREKKTNNSLSTLSHQTRIMIV